MGIGIVIQLVIHRRPSLSPAPVSPISITFVVLVEPGVNIRVVARYCGIIYHIMIYRVATSVIVGSLSVSTSSAFHILSTQHNAISSNVRRITTYLPSTKGPSYCEMCGTPMQIKIPKGDERERHVCSDPSCGHISYQNPKVVVGSICTYRDQVLLCKRAIEPCLGKWGYPQVSLFGVTVVL